MRTVVRPPSSGIGHTTYVGVITRPLCTADAATITDVLAEVGIPVRVVAGPIVHLYALAPVSTRDEARVLAAVSSCTDARAAWCGPRRPVEPACLLCGRTGLELEHDLCAGCGLAFKPAVAVA